MCHYYAKPYVGKDTLLDRLDPITDSFVSEHNRISAAMDAACGGANTTRTPSRLRASIATIYDTPMVYKRICIVMVEAAKSQLTGKWTAIKPTSITLSSLCYPWSGPERVTFKHFSCVDTITRRNQLTNPEEVDRFFGVNDFLKYRPVHSEFDLPSFEPAAFHWNPILEAILDTSIRSQIPLKAKPSTTASSSALPVELPVRLDAKYPR